MPGVAVPSPKVRFTSSSALVSPVRVTVNVPGSPTSVADGSVAAIVTTAFAAAVTWKHAENSDVLAADVVAVAVMN